MRKFYRNSFKHTREERKSRVQGANKEVSPSSICQYNLLQKSDTLLETLYRPEKVSRHLWVQEIRYRIYILCRKKKQIYIIYDGFFSRYKDQNPRLKI